MRVLLQAKVAISCCPVLLCSQTVASCGLKLISVVSLCGTYFDFQKTEHSALEKMKWYSKFTQRWLIFYIFKLCKVRLLIFFPHLHEIIIHPWTLPRCIFPKQKRTFGQLLVSTWQPSTYMCVYNGLAGGWMHLASKLRSGAITKLMNGAEGEPDENTVYAVQCRCIQCWMSPPAQMCCFFVLVFLCVPQHFQQFSGNGSMTIIVFSDHCYCTKLLCKTLRWGNSLLHLRFDQVVLS